MEKKDIISEDIIPEEEEVNEEVEDEDDDEDDKEDE